MASNINMKVLQGIFDIAFFLVQVDNERNPAVQDSQNLWFKLFKLLLGWNNQVLVTQYYYQNWTYNTYST